MSKSSTNFMKLSGKVPKELSSTTIRGHQVKVQSGC